MSRVFRAVSGDDVVTSGSTTTVRSLQERAARALPAEHVEYDGEWWLRRSTSSSWWRGTVLPHGEASREDLTGRIAAAERFYATSALATRFQVCPGACAADLDTVLAGRGYRWDGPMSLRTGTPGEVRTRSGADTSSIRLTETPTDAWFEVWYAIHGDGDDPRTEWEMLDRVELPSAYARVVAGDEILAVGRAVADAGWVGVFGMGTLPAARGRGAGRGILAALADWAVAQSAVGMYLQVETANAPALRLYEAAGFTEAASYHYRTEPTAPPQRPTR
jgi:GNAT superfamily N-acetyltransferase